MLIDLASNTTDAGGKPTGANLMAERERVREKLKAMTVRQLRDFARKHSIPLGGASSKLGLVSEMVGQYRYAWGPEEAKELG